MKEESTRYVALSKTRLYACTHWNANTRMQTDADLSKAETPVCMINNKYYCNIAFYVFLNVQQPYCLLFKSRSVLG